MRRLIVWEFLTLDGVMEAPGFEEHPDGRSGWALRMSDDELQVFNASIVNSADVFLLGRRTYQIWAAFWPTAGADQEFAKRMNDMPKYVVSNTLKRADWKNTTILSGDPAEAVAELKRQPGGDIVVNGSANLAVGLMTAGLVDEYRLMFFPVVLGSGRRLFPDSMDLRYLRLVDGRVFGCGVIYGAYVPESQVPTSRFADDYLWTEEQVRSLQAAEDTDRVLATIMFTDIVDSTGRAAEMGDRRWRKVLDRHDQVARAEVERWRGRFVKATGDGILATFDTPTRALRCAFGLRQSMAGVNLDIRAAIHTGEIELRDGDVGGIGVHIAARALAEAGDRGVVVTRTVRDLATGTDLAFSPLGSVGLRGVPGHWDLYEASIGS